ncbi:thiol reductant ABC exporter subunit CydC [Frondihabitans australicus]|uniref:ATP-binding cassette subfamily C protein CydC n=1 Tax=Frondihabitans australicus TaxID=386892 RepID=A0A495IEF0_9MICO|nr:thiol reductant ABC exporter subunit CydC [Frondihabitans australicus]RKR73878.1 ATP-binding cassette subfamily C protein CydC [Frondihabitans australicus]
MSLIRTAQPPLARSWRGHAAGALSALSGVALLAVSAYLITRAAEQPPILYLSIAIVSVRALALARAFFRYLERLTSHDAAFRQLAVVRTELYRRLVRVAPAGLGQTSRGDLLTRVVTDVDALQDLPLRVVQPLAISGLTALLSVAVVAVISPVGGVVLFAGLAVAFVVGCVVANALARTTESSLADLRGRLGDAVLDLVQNLDVLVAFDAAEAQVDQVRSLDRELRSVSLRRATTTGVVAAILALVSGATVLAALWAVAPSLGPLSGPAYALVVLVPLAVFEVVGSVPVAIVAWRTVRASGARVESAVPAVAPAGVVADDPDAGGGDVSPIELPPVGEVALRLRDVVATWPGAAAPALSGVSLEVRRGDRLVVEGPSGAGKSTLASVLVRFLDHDGTYEIAGSDTRALDARRVRATVGLIEQTPYLFDDSVRQNLLFARDTAGDADLVEVLERVGLGDWLEARGGLDARLGERGALVSGGQAQRISLARALLRGFPILVLDEPAAGVDAALADSLVEDLLATAAADGTTVLLISHVPVTSPLVTGRVSIVGGRVAAVTTGP